VTSQNPPPGQDEPLPYTEITDDTYAERAAKDFTVTELAHGTLALRGPCPRCRAFIEIPVISSIFRSSRSIGSKPHAPEPKSAEAGHKEPMMCTCEDDHAGRPEGRSGCGAYWTLSISLSAR
jgi:hypothetical protein